MKKYALSLSALGPGIEHEEAMALRDFKIRNVEIIAKTIASGDEQKDVSRNITKELIRKGYIIPASIHLPFGEAIWDPSELEEEQRKAVSERLANLIRFLAEEGIGAPNMTLHGSCEPSLHEHSARIQQTRKTIQDLLPLAKELKFSINLEFLPRTCIGNSVEELKQLTEGFDPEYVGICFDVNHIMRRYRELPDMITELAPRIRTFHISDYDGIDECHWIPGQGLIDWSAVMKAINAIDHEVVLILETSAHLCGCQWGRKIKYDPTFAIRENENAVWFMENCERLTKDRAAFWENMKS